MSLFPAYAQELVEDVDYEDRAVGCTVECGGVSLALEAQLLASDNDEEREPPPPVEPPAPHSEDYYVDRTLDCGNLRVSTLYYPGRPQYETQKRSADAATCVFLTESRRAKRRYFDGAPEAAEALSLDVDAELADRTRAYRTMLADHPTDDALWLRFIDFQERCRDVAAALSVAESACASLPASRRLRAALHRLRARALPRRRRRDLLRGDLADCASPELTTELWLRLLEDAAQFGDGAELLGAAAAALGAARPGRDAYPHVLYVYGGYLRSAGLWERLVLLLELVTSMNFPPDAFPPPLDDARMQRAERELQDTEDTAIASGLPLSTVWVRVERARAAAHWRAAGGAAHWRAAGGAAHWRAAGGAAHWRAAGGAAALAPGADPQRAPLPADVAELLLPARAADAPVLLLHALRLAKVPLLPCAGYVLAAFDASNDAAGDSRWAACGEALLALVRAARRLPPAHPARAHGAAGARALVAHSLDPPHYFTDDTGYLSWVSSLWEASCSWSSGPARVALLCWRLRWLHALLLLLDVQDAAGAREAQRVRAEARAALRRWAGDSQLPYAQFARLEHAAGRPAAARRAALLAARAALRAGAAPPERLYLARVAAELCAATPQSWAGAWAAACAALGRPLPPDESLDARPPPELLDAALRECEMRCAALEAQPEWGSGGGALGALLPDGAEWAAARARLAPAPRRAELLRAVRRGAEDALGAAARYWEHGAVALTLAAAQEHRSVETARALAPLFPHNALLALACSGTSLWRCGGRPAALGASHVGALAAALPALLRAAAGAWQPQDAARAAAACSRAARGAAGGALLRAQWLEAGARAPAARLEPGLFAALDDHPNHKWLYVRGAAWCGAQAASLADALLERELRAHALLDELAPPHEELVSPHDEVAPPHEELVSPHDEVAPPHEELVSPHDEVAPPHEQQLLQ